MDQQGDVLKWGSNCLTSKGYSAKKTHMILATPWSAVFKFETSAADFYLKQTTSALFIAKEPQVILVLADLCPDLVPAIVDINSDLHCFIMQDAGMQLRELLKVEFKTDLLCKAIGQYAAIQRATENCYERLFKVGVPDWRIDKLPNILNLLLKEVDFLHHEGLTDQELQTLHDLCPRFLEQCKLLSSYGIPETIGFSDFHDKNVLINPKSNKMVVVDWGETVITHPFFSLYNCLPQAVKHHRINEGDQIYLKLEEACLQPWLDIGTKSQLLECFSLAKILRPIYGALTCYSCMMSVDLQEYKSFYANRPSLIASSLREYIISCTMFRQ